MLICEWIGDELNDDQVMTLCGALQTNTTLKKLVIDCMRAKFIKMEKSQEINNLFTVDNIKTEGITALRAAWRGRDDRLKITRRANHPLLY